MSIVAVALCKLYGVTDRDTVSSIARYVIVTIHVLVLDAEILVSVLINV